jgi:hypothetical protein
MQVETHIIEYQLDWMTLGLAGLAVAGLVALITLVILVRKRPRE